MASPTLTLINKATPTDGVLSNADANSGWANLTTADTDIKVEGTGSMSGITRADAEDSYYDAGVAGVTPGTAVGKVLRGWVNTTNIPYMQPEATNPYELWCYDSSSQSNGLALFGSDTYPGGWFYFWQDMDDFTGVTLANVDRWGIEAGHSGNSKNVINMWMDVLRYLDGYYLTGGTSGDEVTFYTLAATDLASAYGVIQNRFDVFFCTGEIQIGNGSTTTYFEADGEVVVFLDTPGALTISAGLYEINVQGSGCTCVIQNCVLKANGTTDSTRFILDFSDTNADLTFNDNLINRAGTIAFASGQSPSGNVFDDCGQITHGGADLSNSVIKNYEGTADTAALIYNGTTDIDGEIDDSSFTMGTALTHAISFTDATTVEHTLRGITFSGYSASHAQTSSTLYFPDSGSDVDWIINVVNCTGNITYKKVRAGDTVTIVPDPVDITITVQDEDKNLLANAQTSVFLLNSPFTELMNEDTIAGVATEQYSGSVPVDIKWRVRKSETTDDPRYYPESGTGQITASGFILLVTLKENPFI